MQKINRYWNSDPDSLVEREPPQTYDLCKCCELVNQLVWKEKRLQRALWLARAERAKANKYKYETWERNETKKFNWDGDLIAIVSMKARKWRRVEIKCIKKAEEYK